MGVVVRGKLAVQSALQLLSGYQKVRTHKDITAQAVRGFT